ncbi:hypothetical protein PCANC_27645, partial [Puccinia coronata f. sp. avenae]
MANKQPATAAASKSHLPQSTSISNPHPFQPTSATAPAAAAPPLPTKPKSTAAAASTSPKDCGLPRVIDHLHAAAKWNTLETILLNFQTMHHANQREPPPGQATLESSRTHLTVGLTNHLLPFLKNQTGFYSAVYQDQNLAASHCSILLG